MVVVLLQIKNGRESGGDGDAEKFPAELGWMMIYEMFNQRTPVYVSYRK